MQITKEYLVKKLNELEQGRQQMMANVAANEGAIELINVMLAELEQVQDLKAAE